MIDEREEILNRVARIVASRVMLDDALYSTREAAELLGLTVHSVRGISPRELPRVFTGPGGQKLRYLGSDIRAFILSRRRAS